MMKTKERMMLTISKRVEDESYDAAGSHTHTHTKHVPEAHRKSEITEQMDFLFKEVRKYRKKKK